MSFGWGPLDGHSLHGWVYATIIVEEGVSTGQIHSHVVLNLNEESFWHPLKTSYIARTLNPRTRDLSASR